MFKLIKLAIYAFLGYAIYELYQGMMAEQETRSSQGGGQRSGSRGSSRRSSGSRMTGGGPGRQELTEESRGTSASHQVGRGVVS